MRTITKPKTSARLAGPPGAANRPPRIRQVPALSRGIAILRLLGRSDVALGVHDVARSLELVPSTCLRQGSLNIFGSHEVIVPTNPYNK